MKIAIILINWHGADDTIACLESLSKMTEPHTVVVGDNGSTDDSVMRIQRWLDENAEKPNVNGYKVVPLGNNYGFAVGNNKALDVAMQDNPDYCMLLNNDTEVEPDTLTHLVEYARANPDVKVLSPCICYHSNKEKVWFSGGRLTFGTRKNLFAEQPRAAVGLEPFAMDFVSGCALFFAPSLLNEKNELLYNGFFFGEEDYEFSLRMRSMGVKMACVPQSLVYHKVGSSQKNTKDSRGLGRIYMYYHNRLICNRLYESSLKFNIVCMLNCVTCLKYFRRYSGSSRTALKLVRCLFREVRTKSTFDYDDFRALMFENRYFDFDVTLK
ncbi:MAG: glycosyltransferase family 2 protein [Bacteroidaceae bacterium]|nr:glycosyltransferase family 2 protein [Bacteroidaceae bacterium]